MVQEAKLKSFLSRRSLAMLLAGSTWSITTFGHMFVAFLLASVLTREFGFLWPFIWAGVLCLLVIFQAIFSRIHVNTSEETLEEVRRVLIQFTISSYLVGISWATVGLLLFPIQYPELQLFLAFVMGGISLVAVGTLHVYLPACYGSMGFAVPALGIRYIIEGLYIEATLVVLYTFVLIRFANMLSKFSHGTSVLQYERDILLDQLESRASELEVARRLADEANLSKSRFLAQASHDLRQPLHAMGLFIETISDHKLDAKVARVVKRVRQSLGGLSKLFDTLLDVTLLDTGKTQPRPVDFETNEFFAQLARDYGPIALDNRVDIRFMQTHINLHADPILLRRMVQNLVSNAIRHSANGRVLVGLRPYGGRYAIDVVDNGTGIKAEDQKRIFDEFVRLRQERLPLISSTQPGLGLGLSIVYRIATMLGLDILVASEIGKGSRFRISGLEPALGAGVPLMIEDAQPPPSEDLLASANILVIDDDPEILEATGALLSKWGCNIQLHQHASDLFQPADLILCDFELDDDTTGIDVVRQCRKQWGQLPAVIISGNSSEQVKRLIQEEGLALLHKPVRPAQLRSALLQALTAKS